MVLLPSVLFYKHSLQCYVLGNKPNEAEITLNQIEIMKLDPKFRSLSLKSQSLEDCMMC